MLEKRCFILILVIAAVLIALWAVPAHAQQSVQFGAAGDQIEIPHDTTLTPPEITIEVWIRVHDIGDTSQAAGEQTILDKREVGGYNFRLAGDSFPLGAGVVAEPSLIFSAGLVQAFRWHHMAMTQDSDSLRFYFDGSLVEVLPNTYISATSADLRLGDLAGCPSGCLWLRGEIDDLRIWDHARTDSQIVANMHEKLVGDEAGLAAYWDFDGDTGPDIGDLTANGNHGTLYGSAELVDSSAPVGFVPLPAPTGLRTHSTGSAIQVLWKGVPGDVGSYAVYRADSMLVPITPSHLLATVSGGETAYLDEGAHPDTTYFYAVAAVSQGGQPGYPSAEAPGRLASIHKDYLVGAYYYPQYGSNAATWSGSYMREFLVPQQPPLLGHYDSSDPAVIDQHLDWMHEYGIDFLASNWWGITSHEDSVLRENIATALSGRPVMFTVVYDYRQLNDPGNIESTQEDQLVADFTYLAETYFDHPNFLRFQGRPVVFFYRSRLLGGAFEQAFARVRSELLLLGHDLYLVGDEVGRTLTPNIEHLQFLDALTMSRALGRPPRDGYPLDGHAFGGISRLLATWQTAAMNENKGFMPSVSPGSNGRAWNPDYWIIPREIEPGAGETSTLDEYIMTLRAYVDPDLKAVMVATWNDWTTDVQVEPSIVAAATSEDVSGTDNYSGGYTYAGYGTGCLESIQSLLGFDPGQVILETPQNGAAGQPRRITLTWATPEAASTYHLQVSTDPGFASPVVDADLLGETSYEPDTLDANTTFYWRARAQSSGGSGAWSLPFTFTTGTLVPVRLLDFGAVRVEGGEVVLHWTVLESADHSGFHVYRESEGQGDDEQERIRLTAQLLSGRSEYTFTDDTASPREVRYWLMEIDRSGGEHWHGPVSASAFEHRWTLRLTQNHPNPVRTSTLLMFEIPAAGEVALHILDLSGRVVALPFQGHLDPGPHQVFWDGRDTAGQHLSNGIYFYRLSTREGIRSAKLMLLR